MTARSHKDRLARLEIALQAIVALAPEKEPERENYDDTESAFNNGEECGAWEAAKIARKALGRTR